MPKADRNARIHLVCASHTVARNVFETDWGMRGLGSFDEHVKRVSDPYDLVGIESHGRPLYFGPDLRAMPWEKLSAIRELAGPRGWVFKHWYQHPDYTYARVPPHHMAGAIKL